MGYAALAAAFVLGSFFTLLTIAMCKAASLADKRAGLK